MNVDSVKKIVGLQRQNAVYKAMVKRGELREEEAAVMIRFNEDAIARARSQSELPLAGEKKNK